MLPLKVRDTSKTSSSLLCLQRKTTGCTTHSRTPSLTRKAISQGIVIPERAVKKTQVSKQICATIWSRTRAHAHLSYSTTKEDRGITVKIYPTKP